MKKFPKIKYPKDPETDGLLADDVVVTEKFDGANFRFTVDTSLNIVSGSRNVVFVEDGEPLPLDEINTAFRHAVKHLRNNLDSDDRETIGRPGKAGRYVLYGEAMHKHSLKYDVEYEKPGSGPAYFKDEPNVILFDARIGSDGDSGTWLSWDRFEQVADDVGMPTVPVLERGDPEDLDFEIPEQGKYGPIEGIVARRIDGKVRAKKVAEDFKEVNTGSVEKAQDQTEAGQFVVEYITEQRTKKMAHKLVDEGGHDKLHMSMMRDLPREVIKDALAESDRDDDWDADTDFMEGVRSKASSRCARHLKRYLQEF